MKKFKLSLIIMLALILSACAYNASLVKTSYDTLQVSSVAYDTSMKIVSDLYKQGKLSEEKKAEIKEIATVYSEAHNAATEALADYQETKDADDKERLQKQLAAASEALTKLLNLVKPYISEEVIENE